MKKNKTIRQLYLILFFSLLFLCLIAFLVLCLNINNSSVTILSSAIISIIGGGLASVIVAWFVDQSKANTNIKIQKDIREHIMLPTYNTIIVAFLNFARLSNLLDKSIDKMCKKNCIQWLEILIGKLNDPNILKDKELVGNALVSLSAVSNNIHNRITEIKYNRVHLLTYGFVHNDEYYALCQLLHNCDIIYNSIMHSDMKQMTSTLLEMKQNLLQIVPQIKFQSFSLTTEYSASDFWKMAVIKTYAKGEFK